MNFVTAFPKVSLALAVVAVILTCLASCIDETAYWTPEALSLRLAALADDLEPMTDCPEKMQYFSAWVEQNEFQLKQDKEKFDKACAPGKTSSIACMSFQILMSSQIEYSLRGCIGDSSLHMEAIDRLNALAGTAVFVDAAR